MWNNLLFDLDGTLSDPGVGITHAVRHALVALGITPPPLKQLEPFIGPPLNESFEEYFHLSPVQIDEAVFQFREYYQATGIYQNRLYPGMAKFLSKLRQQGKTLYVATTKPAIMAHRVLNRFELAQYFTDVVGSPMTGHGTPKAEIVEAVLHSNAIPPASAVMIGDRRHDVIGGKKNGLATIGVLYGYGNRQEFEAAGADYLAEDLSELWALLCPTGK